MTYNFNDILNRRNNSSMKWEAPYIKKRFHIDIDDHTEIFPMFIADMDFKMDINVKNKLHSLIEEPDFGYFHIQDSFYQSIINWYKDIHYLDIHKNWIVPSIGTISSLHLACDMIASDKEIVIMTPVYGPFLNCAKIGHPITLPLLLEDNRYIIDFINLEKIFKNHNIKVLLFCNPHNPGGRIWSKEELKQLVLLCKQYDVTILSDEIHGDFIFNNQKYTSLLEFHDIYDYIIVSTSPNKTFNISGLSTSFILCTNKQLKEDYESYLNRLHITPNRLGINMIEYVYTYGKEWYKELLKVIQSNIDYIVNTVTLSGCTVMKPEGGFLVWVYLNNVDDVDQFILKLAKDTHVLLETGARFVDNYQGWIRINAATSPNIVQEAMKRFIQFYNTHYQNS